MGKTEERNGHVSDPRL